MIIQCVPNFSEGRRPEVVAAIAGAIRAVRGVRLVDCSSDPDHHRMVATFVGPPDAVREAALAATAVAIASIDLRTHTGVHPRLGALDVLPIVPLRDITLDECAEIARELGREIAERFDLPVFLYEQASAIRRTLPKVRKTAFGTLAPDFGPSTPHPSAGAAVVGARGPLIAYNVVLSAPDTTAACAIARELRAGGASALTGVRALGLPLPSRGMSQVSVNITDPRSTSMGDVFDYVRSRAGSFGVDIVESEVIGAVPGFSAFREIADRLHATGLRPEQILLENWHAE